MTRFVAFGSSNTERAGHCGGRYNSFDWFDVLLHEQFGRTFHIINSGVGGENVHGLLARVDRDVPTYGPNVVFVTVGGNDSAPCSSIDVVDFIMQRHSPAR